MIMLLLFYVTIVVDGYISSVTIFLKNNTQITRVTKINYTSAEIAGNAMSVIKPYLHPSNPLFVKSVIKEFIISVTNLIKKTIISSKKMMLLIFIVSTALNMHSHFKFWIIITLT